MANVAYLVELTNLAPLFIDLEYGPPMNVMANNLSKSIAKSMKFNLLVPAEIFKDSPASLSIGPGLVAIMNRGTPSSNSDTRCYGVGSSFCKLWDKKNDEFASLREEKDIERVQVKLIT